MATSLGETIIQSKYTLFLTWLQLATWLHGYESWGIYILIYGLTFLDLATAGYMATSLGENIF